MLHSDTLLIVAIITEGCRIWEKSTVSHHLTTIKFSKEKYYSCKFFQLTSTETHQFFLKYTFSCNNRFIIRFISHRKHNVIHDNIHSARELSFFFIYWNRYVHRVELHLYTNVYYCRKTFGEHCDIQIAIDYEMKFKNYFTSSFWLNLFEFIVRYVYIIYL